MKEFTENKIIDLLYEISNSLKSIAKSLENKEIPKIDEVVKLPNKIVSKWLDDRDKEKNNINKEN